LSGSAWSGVDILRWVPEISHERRGGEGGPRGEKKGREETTNHSKTVEKYNGGTTRDGAALKKKKQNRNGREYSHYAGFGGGRGKREGKKKGNNIGWEKVRGAYGRRQEHDQKWGGCGLSAHTLGGERQGGKFSWTKEGVEKCVGGCGREGGGSQNGRKRETGVMGVFESKSTKIAWGYRKGGELEGCKRGFKKM